jgi:hypothetical protein
MVFFPWPGDDGQGKEPPPAAETLEPGSNRWHETTRLLDHARRAAISCPIAACPPCEQGEAGGSPDRARI